MQVGGGHRDFSSRFTHSVDFPIARRENSFALLVFRVVLPNWEISKSFVS